MKQTFAIVAGLLLGMSASAAGLSQLTLTISTPGPDAYADGTPVLVGETYLLVYVKEGATFQGVYPDGSLVDTENNVIATTGVAVKGSKCGFKAVQYPAGLYPSGGSWMIVLLDTRDASGAVGGLVAAQGASAGTAAASGDSTSLGALTASESGSAGLTSLTLSTAPAGTPIPQIKALEQNGDGVVNVRFANFSGNALYEVQSTTDLAAGGWQAVSGGTRVRPMAASVVEGTDGASEMPVTVQVPSADKVRFFRVIVPSNN